MRDYSKISGLFWTGKTGKSIRGDSYAQITAMYLLTSSHSNMIGIYHCPVGYIHLDTGLSMEGASKGLQRLFEAGFCTYDEELDLVYVHEMAKVQIGESLKPADNRVKDVQKQYDNLPDSQIKTDFFNKYSNCFCLVDNSKIRSPFEAPSKPVTETGAVTGTEAVAGTETNIGENSPSVSLTTSENNLEKLTGGKVCKAMVDAGLQMVNPSNQTLLTLIDAGAELPEFIHAAQEAVAKDKNFAYALGIIVNQRKEAMNLKVHTGPMPKSAKPANPAEARIFQGAKPKSIVPKTDDNGRLL